jgi:hypothetical protein
MTKRPQLLQQQILEQTPRKGKSKMPDHLELRAMSAVLRRMRYSSVTLHNVAELRDLTARAIDRMAAMQSVDECSVPSEFETLILWLGDFLIDE